MLGQPKELRLPDCYAGKRKDGTWFIVDQEGQEIMGPFQSSEDALNAYADHESRES